jgi:hypothetical protein
MLAPYPEKEMAAHPVSTLVNNPKFDDPRRIEPAASGRTFLNDAAVREA